METLTKKTQRIKLLALDVDGVMTDGSISYSDSGEEIKTFNIKDGLGIKLLQRADIEVTIITGRTSKALEFRAEELGINTITQGREDKCVALCELAKIRQLSLDQIGYMGDDLPDLSAIMAAGIGACPSDAIEPIRNAANWISTARGGHGAVRELADMLLDAKGQLPSIIASFNQK